MYGLNAVSLVFFFGINILAYRLCRCEASMRNKTLHILCWVMLLGNVFRYGFLYPFVMGEVRIPAEFSTVAYFAVPTILLLNREGSKSWAAYSGLMAGFFYYLTMIVLGGSIYQTYPPLDIYFSVFCHGTLYLCGLVTIGTRACSQKDTGKLALGVALVGIRAAIVRPWVVDAKGLFIYKLMDGDVLSFLLPQVSRAPLMPLYYITLSALLLLSMKGFFRLNHNRYRRFVRYRAGEAGMA